MSESSKTKKPVYKKWWFWLAVVVVIGAIGRGGSEGTSGPAKSTAAPVAAKPDPMPPDQAKFVEIVKDAQAKAKSAENDMQRGGIKSAREKSLCENASLFAGVREWVGTLKKVDANSDGKGVIEIEVSRNVLVKTWNNAMSDIGDKTLIEPGSELFNTASQLKKGSRVKFSGAFLRGGQGDCLKESSLSLRGKIDDPEFIFKFDSVSSL